MKESVEYFFVQQQSLLPKPNIYPLLRQGRAQTDFTSKRYFFAFAMFKVQREKTKKDLLFFISLFYPFCSLFFFVKVTNARM
jgi:hypothetical protein